MKQQKKHPKITMTSTGIRLYDPQAEKKREDIILYAKIDLNFVYERYEFLSTKVSEIIRLLKKCRLL